jgi:hypothetical protein
MRNPGLLNTTQSGAKKPLKCGTIEMIWKQIYVNHTLCCFYFETIKKPRLVRRRGFVLLQGLENPTIVQPYAW